VNTFFFREEKQKVGALAYHVEGLCGPVRETQFGDQSRRSTSASFTATVLLAEWSSWRKVK